MISRRALLVAMAAAATTIVLQSRAQAALPERIVIAPPRSDLAKALRLLLRAERETGDPAAAQRYYAYGSRGFAAAWVEQTAQGWTLGSRGERLQAAFRGAGALGLDAGRYAPVESGALADIDAAAAAELNLTRLAMRFAQDNYGGTLTPLELSSNLDMVRQSLDESTVLADLLSADEPGQLLVALAPQQPEFQALLGFLTDVDTTADELPIIEEGPSLKPGATDDRVVTLRQRLGVPAVGEADPALFDEQLVAAVEAFQSSLGLVADGIVGNATREALNLSGRVTRDQIVANLEKWRWLPRERGAYRVEVNIPEYRLRVLRDEAIIHETKVVVGTAANQTPVFYDNIRHAVVNPYWNVPSSIARGEIGPEVKRDPGYLARNEYELLTSGGKVIDPFGVDWSRVAPGSFPYLIRQKPGPKNALGQVKFLFPNKHDVYLHDTPEKSLFGRDARAFSHGCVRVQNPFDFAAVLLANEPTFGADDLIKAFGPNERWFNMSVTVPVFLTYFTLRVDETGALRSYADLYGHDKSITAALLAQQSTAMLSGEANA